MTPTKLSTMQDNTEMFPRHFDAPAYVLDFRDAHTRNQARYANPGETVSVVVRQEQDHKSPGIPARGRRSTDGKSFVVTVTTTDGTQEHEWEWGALQIALR